MVCGVGGWEDGGWGWEGGGGCFKGEKVENEVITCSATVIAQIVGGKPLSFMFFTCPTSIALNGITGLLVLCLRY